jgi:hypothetical protein
MLIVFREIFKSSKGASSLSSTTIAVVSFSVSTFLSKVSSIVFSKLIS